MSIAIRVENLSKQYRLGDIGTGTLKDDAQRFWHKLRGKEDPFSRLGEENDRTVAGSQAYVWALKDISFEVQQGEVLGIIGRNGAGKSTLLKILSRVTEPTRGRISITGRVASLLEVGTGMHPDLTGRENIYLNGAILGMRKKEIDRKFDAIVDFAGVARYIDTPVKRYSSGMHVRLGFAVAAHLDPEILVVDEVLAVGDAEFQKKCLGKMKEVSINDGRTILFVSHNLGAINKLCDKAILLSNGVLAKGKEEVSSILNSYLQMANTGSLYEVSGSRKKVFISKAFCANMDGEQISEWAIGENWKLIMEIESHVEVPNLVPGFGIVTSDGIPVHTSWMEPSRIVPGKYLVEFSSNDILFASGMYSITVGLSNGKDGFDYVENALSFEIVNMGNKCDPRILNSEQSSGIILNQMNARMVQLSK